MIITELLVVLSVIATKYHGCLPGGIQLCGATAAITGVLILVVLARFGISRTTFLTNTNGAEGWQHFGHAQYSGVINTRKSV